MGPKRQTEAGSSPGSCRLIIIIVLIIVLVNYDYVDVGSLSEIRFNDWE